jgi:hypothetical protein
MHKNSRHVQMLTVVKTYEDHEIYEDRLNIG